MCYGRTALESRARYAAKRVGLRAKKSRGRKGSCDNFGKFMLIEPIRNIVVAGQRFDLEPEAVISLCENIEPNSYVSEPERGPRISGASSVSRRIDY
jgi:hypothetical protein